MDVHTFSRGMGTWIRKQSILRFCIDIDLSSEEEELLLRWTCDGQELSSRNNDGAIFAVSIINWRDHKSLCKNLAAIRAGNAETSPPFPLQHDFNADAATSLQIMTRESAIAIALGISRLKQVLQLAGAPTGTRGIRCLRGIQRDRLKRMERLRMALLNRP